jgi:hypothetical protein
MLMLSSVIVLHEKGGGSQPAHNLISSCTALEHLSRFAILKYSMDNSNLTPLTQQLTGHLDCVPSFLYVKPHKLLCLLDPLCIHPTSFKTTLDHGLDILTPSLAFCNILEDLRMGASDLAYRATLLSQAEAMRGPHNKRVVMDDDLDVEPLLKRR